MRPGAETADQYVPDPEIPTPDVSAIVTEDDQPVDNIYSEKQQRLLTEPLYASWGGPLDEKGAGRPFFAAASVGVFATVQDPPLVPDVLVSLDAAVHPSFLREKRHRTYFIWEHGKPPDVVIEVVSNRGGDELGRRRRGYARLRVAYYVVWDPAGLLGSRQLQGFELRGDLYVPIQQLHFASLGLALAPWEGEFEGARETWLRWYLPDGQVVPTGAERAEAERQRAEAERQRAEAERQRAEAEQQRAEAEQQRAEAERQRAEAAEERIRQLEAQLHAAAGSQDPRRSG